MRVSFLAQIGRTLFPKQTAWHVLLHTRVNEPYKRYTQVHSIQDTYVNWYNELHTAVLLLAFTPEPLLPSPFELVELALDEHLVLLLPVDDGAFFVGRLPLRACREEDERDVVVDGRAVSLVVAVVAVEAAIVTLSCHELGLF